MDLLTFLILTFIFVYIVTCILITRIASPADRPETLALSLLGTPYLGMLFLIYKNLQERTIEIKTLTEKESECEDVLAIRTISEPSPSNVNMSLSGTYYPTTDAVNKINAYLSKYTLQKGHIIIINKITGAMYTIDKSEFEFNNNAYQYIIYHK